MIRNYRPVFQSYHRSRMQYTNTALACLRGVRGYVCVCIYIYNTSRSRFLTVKPSFLFMIMFSCFFFFITLSFFFKRNLHLFFLWCGVAWLVIYLNYKFKNVLLMNTWYNFALVLLKINTLLKYYFKKIIICNVFEIYLFNP